jgi:hypothetical protein
MGPHESEIPDQLASPDPAAVVELCAILSARPRRSLDLKLLRTALRTARVRHAGNAAVLAAIGQLYLRAGLLKDAQEALTQVVRLTPDHGGAFALLGEALVQQGDARRAAVAFDQALEAGVEDHPFVMQRRDQALSLIAVQDEHGEAEAAFQAGELFGNESRTSSGPPPTPPPDSHDDLPPDLYDDVPMTPPPLSLKPIAGTRYSVVPAAPNSKPSTRPRAVRLASRAPRELPAEQSTRRRDDRREPDEDSGPALDLAFPVPPPPRVPALEVPEPSRVSSEPPPVGRPSTPPAFAESALSVRSPPLAAPLGGREEPPRLPFRRSVLVGIVGFGIAAGGIVLGAINGGFFRSPDAARKDEELDRKLRHLILEQGVTGLDAARELLRPARASSPGDPSLALWDLKLQTAAVLDAGAEPAELRRALGDARGAGLGESQVSFAAVAEAVAEPITDKLRRFADQRKIDAQTTYREDGFYHLALGALCTRLGDPHAAQLYRQALALEPHLLSARVRLINELLADPSLASEGRQLAGDLASAHPDWPEGAALLALSQRGGSDLQDYAAQLNAATQQLDRLPVFLRSQLRALASAMEPDSARAQALLSIAVEEAVTPAAAVLAGGIALALGHPAVGSFATQKALAMAPDYEPARALGARAALLAGNVESAEKTSAELSAAAAGDLAGMLAYESFDLFRLGRTLDALPQGAPARIPLSSAVLRLQASRAFERTELLELSRADPLWGALIAIDAALDAGDLALARELASPWADHPSPLQAIRLGRLLRYEGRSDDAHVVIASAAATEHGLVEKMMLSQDRKERQRILDEAPPSTLPIRKWLHVLHRAMDKSFPQSLRAAAALETPGTDDSLPTRVLSAYALMLNSDKTRARDVLRPVLSAVPKHQDAIFAAVSVGLLPPSALQPSHRP